MLMTADMAMYKYHDARTKYVHEIVILFFQIFIIMPESSILWPFLPSASQGHEPRASSIPLSRGC